MLAFGGMVCTTIHATEEQFPLQDYPNTTCLKQMKVTLAFKQDCPAEALTFRVYTPIRPGTL